MRVRNYQEAVDTIYPHLSEYLEEKGINTSKLFSCITPDHNDKNPSCGVVPSGDAWNCFGCGATGTIIDAVGYLDNKPVTGQGFITETLPFLAEKYGVKLEHEPLNEDELYELETYRAYRIAGQLISSNQHSPGFESAIRERGWSATTCNKVGIGSVQDYKRFKESLKQAGFSAKFLSEIDLNRETIFGPDRIIFTIRDANGRTVGFASRDINHIEGKENAKYVNQKSTGVKCNIYQKSKRLFGFDNFLKSKGKKATPLYIMEGYGDVATAIEHGFDNCSAIGGTALTPDHIYMLKEHGVYDIILCLDGDIEGQKATARVLDKVISGHKDLRVKIVIIPEEKDPDEYIRQYGIEAFKNLVQHSAFEWRLNQFDSDADAEMICESMIPLIVNETSYIKQEKMCTELAQATGYTLKTIQSELSRLQNVKEGAKIRELQNVADRLASEIRKDPSNIQHYIQQADINLYDIARKYEENAFSEDAFVSRILEQKHHEESMDGSFSGFILSSDLYELQKNLAGNWKKDVWLVIGGKANSGKTSLMCKIMWDIATLERENNACVIYHTIDDTFEQVLPKFVCLGKGSTRLHLNDVMNPKYAARDTLDSNVLEDRDEGYNRLLDMAKRGRLIIKDANDGVSIAYADNLIRRMKEKYPDRNIVYVLDNFHKLSDLNNVKDERVRFKELSKLVKGLATKHHISVITTVEYRKTKEKAGNEDILETGQIEYDANLIAHVHNEMHEKGVGATMIHRDNNGERLPIIEFQVGKNKITSFKDRMYFQFFPASSSFMGVSPEMVANWKRAEKEKQGSNSDEHQAIYKEVTAIVRENGWKPARAMYLMMERLEMDTNDEEDRKLGWDIFNKCGGSEGVYAQA